MIAGAAAGKIFEMLDFRDLPNLLRKQRTTLQRLASSMGSLLVGFVAQALSFLVLAHFLGTVQLGHLMVITSGTALAATWCGFGSNELLRRHVGRDRCALPDSLGHCLIMILCTGPVLLMIFIAGTSPFLPTAADRTEAIWILVLLGTSNIVLTSFINLTESAYLAVEDFTRANLINGGLGVARALTAIVACLLFGVTDLLAWACWYASLHLFLCLICALMILRVAAPRWRVIRSELPLGISFSLSNFLLMLRSNIDILVLTAIATPHFVGVYGAARRIVAAGIVVPGAFDRLIYGRLAISGRSGPLATLRLAKRYLAISVALSTTTSILLFVAAGFVPWLIGADYADAVSVIQILCWTLVSTAVQFLAFDSLTAAEQHRTSTTISGTTNIIGAAMVVWLGSTYGVIGIFVSLYLSDIVRGAAMWTALQLMSRRQANQSAPESGEA